VGVLRAAGQVDFSQATFFGLDEFVGIPGDHAGSFRAYLERHLFSVVNFDRSRINFLRGDAPNLDAECRRYDNAIAAAGGIDLQILGIGANGHIGFNEPAAGLCANTHVAHLQQESREANAQRFGGDWTRVPERALSMGMSTILGAHDIVLIATGEEKREAVKGMIEGLITTMVPASLLQVHPRVTVMLDAEAWSG